jgi:membrane-bound lytic murein transglycosylase B
VITRYNRSPMYAMAVNQLAQAIAEGVNGPESASR